MFLNFFLFSLVIYNAASDVGVDLFSCSQARGRARLSGDESFPATFLGQLKVGLPKLRKIPAGGAPDRASARRSG